MPAQLKHPAIVTQRMLGIDLISYQHYGKGCAAITDEVPSVSEYSSECMDMSTGKVLISHESVPVRSDGLLGAFPPNIGSASRRSGP